MLLDAQVQFKYEGELYEQTAKYLGWRCGKCGNEMRDGRVDLALLQGGKTE